ncbi:tRNA (adenosine(37)-N6)-threonylcarbamoyltransferase complex transferase subunit TsaD [Pajaroellobacter abortibovis]|uniref:tRNA N6-adenosine threonylcarbamoyltransferase n=1 Tax=Pajaroellobacter abortibovis TaxID=1882918 RepID=A0A1L6MZ79_9BACT|nr:tRNA (adenosine(37)-N6)-threonylcarbamoyltransferase complex transferase subunit TsaD [Pajaroellobacter abortibovis]APS00800.1 tRNA (adenosine(37)-N6)-threonylcarbamoyltransferase complex transferase subunit TsaD [Pajaroellobacter abortibovis]
MKLILGIESSCDETAAALVLADGTVLSDVIQSQVQVHAVYGGVVPELASRNHAINIVYVVREALQQAGVSVGQVDGVAVTNRPGLVGALLVGVQVAKGIAWAARKPLVGVDHLFGHVMATFLKYPGHVYSAPEFPFICLLVSGGHTAIYRVDSPSHESVHELGATRDDAVGECFDKVAKVLGLSYPGGPIIDRFASNGDPTRFSFVAPMAYNSNLEFSFSGLKAQLVRHVAKYGRPASEKDMADLCASFQATVTQVLVNKLVKAALQEEIKRVVLGGGVAANEGLRGLLIEQADRFGLFPFIPPVRSCTDNAAMIAYAGSFRLMRREQDGWNLGISSQGMFPPKTRKGRGAR